MEKIGIVEIIQRGMQKGRQGLGVWIPLWYKICAAKLSRPSSLAAFVNVWSEKLGIHSQSYFDLITAFLL